MMRQQLVRARDPDGRWTADNMLGHRLAVVEGVRFVLQVQSEREMIKVEGA